MELEVQKQTGAAKHERRAGLAKAPSQQNSQQNQDAAAFERRRTSRLQPLVVQPLF